jgi:hypothetical protein
MGIDIPEPTRAGHSATMPGSSAAKQLQASAS